MNNYYRPNKLLALQVSRGTVADLRAQSVDE